MEDFEEYLDRVAGILRTPQRAHLNYLSYSFIVEYWIIPPFEVRKRNEIMVNIPGSTSGAEDAAELPLFLASLGFEVLIYSPPGEGNSSKAPGWFFKTPTFHHEAKIALALLEHLKIERAVLLSHSNGASTAATATVLAPENGIEVSTLVMMNPADLKRIPTITGLYLRQMAKFAVSGTLTRLYAGREEAAFRRLRNYFPAFKIPFRWSHFGKMIWELRKSSRGNLPTVLQFVKCPVVALFSWNDFVFPARSRFGTSRIDILKQCVIPEKLTIAEVPGPHNVTMGEEVVRSAGWELAQHLATPRDEKC